MGSEAYRSFFWACALALVVAVFLWQRQQGLLGEVCRDFEAVYDGSHDASELKRTEVLLSAMPPAKAAHLDAIKVKCSRRFL